MRPPRSPTASLPPVAVKPAFPNDTHNKTYSHRKTSAQIPTMPRHRHFSQSSSGSNSDSTVRSPPSSRRIQRPCAQDTHRHDRDNEHTIHTTWPNVLRPRPSRSRVAPVVLTGPPPVHKRAESTSTASSSASLSSLSSSRTKPAPAKSSMLHRTSSVSTKNSAAKSVKFVDAPMVYYDYAWSADAEPWPRPAPSLPPEPKPPRTGKFLALKRLLRQITSGKPPAAARPAISGPHRLSSISSEASLRSAASKSSVAPPGRSRLGSILGRVTCMI